LVFNITEEVKYRKRHLVHQIKVS